jgi:hypothetical protein
MAGTRKGRHCQEHRKLGPQQARTHNQKTTYQAAQVCVGLQQRPLKTVGVIVKPRSTVIPGAANYCHKKEPRAGLARGALEVCCLRTLGFWEGGPGVGGHRGMNRPPGLTVIPIKVRPLDFNWRDVALISVSSNPLRSPASPRAPWILHLDPVRRTASAIGRAKPL